MNGIILLCLKMQVMLIDFAANQKILRINLDKDKHSEATVPYASNAS